MVLDVATETLTRTPSQLPPHSPCPQTSRSPLKKLKIQSNLNKCSKTKQNKKH